MRQNAGRLINVWLNGVVNEPAGTLCAIVIVTFGIERAVRLSHVPVVDELGAVCAMLAAGANGATTSTVTSSEPRAANHEPRAASRELRASRPEPRVPSPDLHPTYHLAEHGSGSHAVLSGSRL